MVDSWFFREGVPALYKALLVELAFGVAINVLMNTYWGYLILRQLYRMCFKNKSDADFATDKKLTDK